MLDGANGDELFDTVFLGKLGGSLDKAILIRSAREVIMSEVHDILSTLETDVKVSSCLSLELL